MAPAASRRPRSSSATNSDAYSSNSSDNSTMAPPPAKKPRATATAAASTSSSSTRPASPRQQGPVVFWFRSKDLRVRDNTALYRAWVQAAQVERAARCSRRKGVACVGAHDECIVAPGVVKSKDNKVYTVYTPFRKAWQDLVKRKHPQDWLAMSPDPGANPASVRTVVPDLFGTAIPEATHEALSGYTLPIDESVLAHTRVAWPAGETAAHDRLKRFAQAKLSAYSVDRDFPALDGCSSMSGYLTAGVISARACFNVARAANGGQIDTGDKGAVHWMQELVWREFYRHILVAFPRVSMNQPFKLDTKLVKWTDHDPATKDEAERHFTAWCEGKTGYPIVDAAMRMLVREGYLSNRLRMVAAMFLTKDLLIDWRRGERFFMRHLIDGDLAQNNGGWQWSASTGTDSQPYFRVFNPYLQSEKFDPDAVTIRKYVPELRAVKDSKALHEPHARLPAAVFVRTGYPRPIVDHKAARVRAINAFKIAAGKVV
ncbi:hypothetical protein AMAG_01193 [Allomyces macrogynus ATCC 38327]|uniref:Photolyase/cryptochrome alpha/beta domain-containing protein n=1 Tax=Allomyces macrogynus (strain ATCC 38327) TaxID=578462 RepID=A0A0L0RY42_ALLM3|nr:hypothetical protein AMAG_01193 [Allomyces macrogynus ATCC 38327]|eukprot:KNE55283.1 hypothetical protein AMAG_01193 [Allomyces macrogynus ATCC 38327]